MAEVLDELTRTLGRIFRDKGVMIDWDADEDLYFMGERQDLLEIAGNAIENACKWCKAPGCGCAAEAVGAERMLLTVEDDGSGLPPDRRERGAAARRATGRVGARLGPGPVDHRRTGARAYGGDR